MKAFLEKLTEENKKTKEELSALNKSIKALYETSVDSHKAQKVTNEFLQKLVEGQAKDRKYEEQKDKKAEQDKNRSKADRVLKGSDLVKDGKVKGQKKSKGLLESILGGFGGILGSGGTLKALGLAGLGSLIGAYFVSPEFREAVNEHVLTPMWEAIKEGLVGDKGLFGRENREKIWTWMQENPLQAIGAGALGLVALIGPKSALGLAFTGLSKTIPLLASGVGKLLGVLSSPIFLKIAALVGAPVALAGSGAKGLEEIRKNIRGGGSAADFGAELDARALELSEKNARGPRGGARTGSKVNLTKEEKEELELLNKVRQQIKESNDRKNNELKNATKVVGTGRSKKSHIDPDEKQRIEDAHQKRVEEIRKKNKLQKGGPVRVPGTGSGDKVPAILPTGSFVLNREATKTFYAQKGGQVPSVPAMLEPGEMVFPKATENLERMNSSVPRFGSPRKNNGGANEMMLDPQTQYLQKGGKVFLHWAGTPHNGSASPNYHATIMKDGTPKKTRDYNKFGGGHTAGFNSQGIGISLDAMGMFDGKWPDFGDFGPYAVKPEQYEGMATLTAQIIKDWGYGPEYVTKSNVMTHAEAANIGDSKGGYGPTSDPNKIPPGDYRWDLWGLYENSTPGSGGDEIRNMIKSAFNGVTPGTSPTPIGDPIVITDYDMNGKIDQKDVNFWTDFVLRKKPNTGQVVKFGTTDKHKIYDGEGWTDYDPKTQATSITQQTLKPTPGSIFTKTDTSKDKENTSFLSGIFSGAFEFLKNIPLIGDFIQGFEEGFKEKAQPGGIAEGIMNFIFNSGKEKDKSIEPGSGEWFKEKAQVKSGDDEINVSSQPLTGDIAEKAKMMFDYIVSKGYSSAQAKGIVANIQRESTFDPKVRSGDDGGPGGLFQWKGDRQTQKVADLVNSGNWKGQIDYALKEDAGPRYLSETAGMNAFDASMWWAREWERPASLENARKKHTQFLSSYGFQKGGYVGAILEPGEGVFTPEMMNDMIPRFQKGGSVNMRGELSPDMTRFIGANNMKREHSVSTMVMQPIVMPMSGGGQQVTPVIESGDADVPTLSNTGPDLGYAYMLDRSLGYIIG